MGDRMTDAEYLRSPEYREDSAFLADLMRHPRYPSVGMRFKTVTLPDGVKVRAPDDLTLEDVMQHERAFRRLRRCAPEAA